MKEIILEKLNEIERDYNVKILYSCESGSRAWGFASPDSDFDVRFIYVHPLEWYLKIDEGRDVIELPVNEILDISGWELRKALKLFRKSNATIYEWIQSPIIYKKEDDFYKTINHLSKNYFSLRAGMNHYLSMANGCFDHDLQGENVKLKKYFYALRPLLACKWIIEKKEIPPMEFSKLRNIISESIIQLEIDKLLVKKMESNEKTFISTNNILNDFIKKEISFLIENEKSVEVKNNKTDELNLFFRNFLK